MKFFLTKLSKRGYTTPNPSATEYARKGNEEKSRPADRSQRAPEVERGTEEQAEDGLGAVWLSREVRSFRERPSQRRSMFVLRKVRFVRNG